MQGKQNLAQGLDTPLTLLRENLYLIRAKTFSVRINESLAFSGFGFRVSGFGFRVSGFGFRVSGFGFRVSALTIGIVHARPPKGNWNQVIFPFSKSGN